MRRECKFCSTWNLALSFEGDVIVTTNGTGRLGLGVPRPVVRFDLRFVPPDPAPAKPCPEPRRDGPAGPARTLYGLSHLRAVQNLSTAVSIGQVCEEAALELTRLCAEQRPHRWTDSDTL